jgi:hypothetical protein
MPRLEEQQQQLGTETEQGLVVFYFVTLFIN